jgi:hypothetical protein
MSELPIGIFGGSNPCYTFFTRTMDCIRRESFYTLMCRNEYDDFIECKFAKRHVI